MLRFHSMEQVALEVLHSAFVDAFSDYQVKIELPYGYFNRCSNGGGIAESILAELIKNTEADRIGILNVELQAVNMVAYLKKLGFTDHVGQYEMLLEL